jgi:hypothetical protein
MIDFQTNRQKALDLVIARPTGLPGDESRTFKSLAEHYGIRLTAVEGQILNGLPDIAISNVGAVLIALEAKAAMTSHQKAEPRLYDELNSSHLCVHGASNQALAIAYVQVNSATEFASSVRNNFPLADYPVRLSRHTQPKSVIGVIDKVAELPRRSGTAGVGFDGVGVTVLNFENTGGPVDLVDQPPSPQPGDPFHYESMIIRMANEYDSRFHGI